MAKPSKGPGPGTRETVRCWRSWRSAGRWPRQDPATRAPARPEGMASATRTAGSCSSSRPDRRRRGSRGRRGTGARGSRRPRSARRGGVDAPRSEYAKSGDADKAVFYYERASSLDPYEADAKVRQAQSSSVIEVRRGLPLLKRAQELKPRDDSAATRASRARRPLATLIAAGFRRARSVTVTYGAVTAQRGSLRILPSGTEVARP